MTFLFHRLHEGKPFFYPVDLPNEAEVLPNVEANPGTQKVTTPDGRVVWSLQ
jgi:hypothetical protein